MPTQAVLDAAIETLMVFERQQPKYASVNDAAKTLQGDFPTLVQMIDDDIESAVVKMLDSILGDDIASYYLYEVRSMKGGGSITEVDGRTWPIRNVADVRAYATRSGVTAVIRRVPVSEAK